MEVSVGDHPPHTTGDRSPIGWVHLVSVLTVVSLPNNVRGVIGLYTTLLTVVLGLSPSRTPLNRLKGGGPAHLKRAQNPGASKSTRRTGGEVSAEGSSLSSVGKPY